MRESFHLKLEPSMRMSCDFERERGFIFNCKPFSFKDRIRFLVGAATKKLNKINRRLSIVAVPQSTKKLGHIEAGGQQIETAEYFIAWLVILRLTVIYCNSCSASHRKSRFYLNKDICCIYVNQNGTVRYTILNANS